MGIKYGGKKVPEEKKPYVPPMQGSSDASKGMKPTQRPLMLTNGSDAPGAASAHARAASKGEEYQSSAMRVSWFYPNFSHTINGVCKSILNQQSKFYSQNSPFSNF